MAYEQLPIKLDYTEANRSAWATQPDELTKVGTAPNAAANRFALFAYNPVEWNQGDFVLNLDQWLVAKLPALNGKEPKKLQFGLVGCHGVSSGYNFSRGYSTDALGKISKALSDPQKYHFNFILGDNVYHFGATSPRSETFATCFHALFKYVETFAILGNHDYNIHSTDIVSKLAHPWLPKGYRGMYQVYHSYLDAHNPKNVDNLVIENQYFDNKDLGPQNRWNMPYRYYAMVSEATNTVFICLDTNTFIFEAAQQDWCYQIYHKLKSQLDNPNFILIAHHPLQYYSSRRTKHDQTKHKPEWHRYIQKDLPSDVQGLSSTPITRIHNLAPTETDSFTKKHEHDAFTIVTVGRHLKQFLANNNLRFKAGFFAHEHLLAYEELKIEYVAYNQGKRGIEEESFHQFISGAVAKLNKLDPSVKMILEKNPKDLKCFESTYGYADATLDRTELVVTYYDIKDHRAIHNVEVPLNRNNSSNA